MRTIIYALFWIKALVKNVRIINRWDLWNSWNNNGIETLNFMEPQMAADIIRDEHPQIITYLDHNEGQAAIFLPCLMRNYNDVMLRIATFGGVQPSH